MGTSEIIREWNTIDPYVSNIFIIWHSSWICHSLYSYGSLFEQRSAGKYIRDSGFEDALIETKTFAVQVVESVFDGIHYIRSLRGLLIFCKAIHSLQWKAFWLRYPKVKFKEDLNEKLYQSLILEDIDVANLLNEAVLNIATLKEVFHEIF